MSLFLIPIKSLRKYGKLLFHFLECLSLCYSDFYGFDACQLYYTKINITLNMLYPNILYTLKVA